MEFHKLIQRPIIVEIIWK